MPVPQYSQNLWTNPAGNGSSPRAKKFLNQYEYFDYNGVSYREKVPTSPTFSFDKDGNSRCVREFYIPWQGQLSGQQLKPSLVILLLYPLNLLVILSLSLLLV